MEKGSFRVRLGYDRLDEILLKMRLRWGPLGYEQLDEILLNEAKVGAIRL